MKQNKKKCGYMILTPHYDNGHEGGLWCAEDYPCKKHGKWRGKKIKVKTSTSATGKLKKIIHACMDRHADLFKFLAEH